jgi:hypothetical protein
MISIFNLFFYVLNYFVTIFVCMKYCVHLFFTLLWLVPLKLEHVILNSDLFSYLYLDLLELEINTIQYNKEKSALSDERWQDTVLISNNK